MDLKLPDNYKLLCETDYAVFAHNRLNKIYAAWTKDINGGLCWGHYFSYHPFTETTEKEAYKKALHAFADKG